jgi:hypothetical protein
MEGIAWVMLGRPTGGRDPEIAWSASIAARSTYVDRYLSEYHIWEGEFPERLQEIFAVLQIAAVMDDGDSSLPDGFDTVLDGFEDSDAIYYIYLLRSFPAFYQELQQLAGVEWNASAS